MELLLLPVLLFFAYLVFVTVTVLLAKLFFTKVNTTHPERDFFKHQARVRAMRRKSVVNSL